MRSSNQTPRLRITHFTNTWEKVNTSDNQIVAVNCWYHPFPIELCCTFDANSCYKVPGTTLGVSSCRTVEYDCQRTKNPAGDRYWEAKEKENEKRLQADFTWWSIWYHLFPKKLIKFQTRRQRLKKEVGKLGERLETPLSRWPIEHRVQPRSQKCFQS